VRGERCSSVVREEGDTGGGSRAIPDTSSLSVHGRWCTPFSRLRAMGPRPHRQPATEKEEVLLEPAQRLNLSPLLQESPNPLPPHRSQLPAMTSTEAAVVSASCSPRLLGFNPGCPPTPHTLPPCVDVDRLLALREGG
jgi:hypothetical protein